MNLIVVFEDQATKQCQQGKPYAFASALEVPCPCGNLIHPNSRCLVPAVRHEGSGSQAREEN
jgi:hypothetical protein